ncbi:MAG: PmbA/TldA family metallopeptidase, partial [Candidatus Bathyarchaeia archaeon]
MEEDLALFAIDRATKLGAEYADARLEAHYNELVTVANGKVDRAAINQKRGIGIRALVKGAWGFQSTTNLTKAGVKEATSIAFKIAEASSKHVAKPVKLAPAKAYRDSYAVEVKVDLEDIALEDKLKQFLKWEKRLHASKNVVRGLIEYT